MWAWSLSSMWDLSSPTRDRTSTSCIVRWILENWITREVPLPQFLIYHASISSRNISRTLKLSCPMGLVIWYLLHQFAVKIKWFNTSKVLRTVPGTWLCVYFYLPIWTKIGRTLSFTPGFLQMVVFKFSWPLLPVKNTLYLLTQDTQIFTHLLIWKKKKFHKQNLIPLSVTDSDIFLFIPFHFHAMK